MAQVEPRAGQSEAARASSDHYDAGRARGQQRERHRVVKQLNEASDCSVCLLLGEEVILTVTRKSEAVVSEC